MAMVAAFRRSRFDDAEAEVDEVGDVRFGSGDDLEVVGLVLLGDADLEEAVELCTVLAAALGHLDEAFDVRKAQDRREARTRDTPMGALALPIGESEGLEASDGGGGSR